MSGKQIKLFLVEGSPGGLVTAEITNWTGHVLAGPRSDLALLLAREETHRTGIYLLLGADENGENLYIGEADDVSTRLRTHERKKPDWDRVVIVTSKDTNLTKAHVRYLESSLIRLATAGQRIQLTNETAPPTPNLPEADASDMDYFVSQLHIMLPVLGINAFRSRKTAPLVTSVEPLESPIFHLRVPRSGVDAQAMEVDGEFTILAGSHVVSAWRGEGKAESVQRSYARYQEKYEQLVATGVVRVVDGQGIITRDFVASSPSAAGVIVTGRACNGRRDWATDDAMMFGTWENRGIE